MDAEIERMRDMLSRLRKSGIYQVTVQQALTAIGRGFKFLPSHYEFSEGGIGDTRWIDIHTDNKCIGRVMVELKPRGVSYGLNWFGDTQMERTAPLSLIDFHLKEMEAEVVQPTEAIAGDRKGEPRSYGLANLRQKLVEHFSIDELRTLCFDIGIKHENLPADTLDGMARELVSYCERACRIPELVAQCRKLRPNVSWE